MKLSSRNILLISTLVLLLIARAVAPAIILDKMNSYLATFSETYTGHIADFDLSLIRGAYRLEGFSLALKAQPQKPFTTAEVIDISVAWREIFSGRIVTDIVTTNLNLILGHSLIEVMGKDTAQGNKEAKDVGATLFPVSAERVELKNSRIEYTDYAIYIDNIDGRLSNATPTKEDSLSLLTLRGALLGKAFIKIFAKINQTSEPLSWLLSAELQQLNMVEVNSQINKSAPLTFKSGQLNLFTEMKSEDGRISGYLKPFLKNAEFVGDDKDFKGIKHFGVEISIAFLNLFFRNSKDHTVATKVLFTYDNEKFNWNVYETLSLLFKNGYQEPLNPGIENLLTLSEKNNDHKNNIKKEN